MAIQLMGAILHRFTATDFRKRVTLVEPVGPMTIPASARALIESGQYEGVNAELPSCKATLIIYGGSGAFTISCALVGPPGSDFDMPMDTTRIDWPAGQLSHRIEVAIDGKIQIRTPGRYAFKFLIDGVPLTELAFPIFWDDEVPA